jgi:hypothetical protein
MVLVFFAPLVYGQHEITVRVVDAKSGKPVKKAYAGIYAWSGTWDGMVTKNTKIISDKHSSGGDGSIFVVLPARQSPEATLVFSKSTKTDNAGRIIIHMPDDTPERIAVTFSPLKFVATCGIFSPGGAFNSGLVLLGSTNQINSKIQLSAGPGEVVILVHKVSAWHNMLQEIP